MALGELSSIIAGDTYITPHPGRDDGRPEARDGRHRRLLALRRLLAVALQLAAVRLRFRPRRRKRNAFPGGVDSDDLHLDLLAGSEVAVERAGRHTGLGVRNQAREAGLEAHEDAEVGDLHAAVARHEHVGGLHVEVQNAILVRECERCAHRVEDGCGLIGSESATHVVEQHLEARAVNELHDHERLVGVGLEVVDGDDRGMVEHRGGAGLGESRRVVEDGAGSVAGKVEPLDGDSALHARVPCKRDGREAALAQLLERVGLPEALLSDRASVFYGPATRHAGLSTYQIALEAVGTKAIFAKPYKPRTKGKIEKFIGFVERDFIWEIKDSVSSLPALQAAWEQWYAWYDQARPHASLGDVPPAARYTPSRRPAPRELRQLLRVETSRLVRRDATISVRGRRWAVPPELMGKHVWVGLLGDQITIEHAGHVVATYTQ